MLGVVYALTVDRTQRRIVGVPRLPGLFPGKLECEGTAWYVEITDEASKRREYSVVSFLMFVRLVIFQRPLCSSEIYYLYFDTLSNDFLYSVLGPLTHVYHSPAWPRNFHTQSSKRP